MGCGRRAGAERRSVASGSSEPQKMLAKQGRNYPPWPPPPLFARGMAGKIVAAQELPHSTALTSAALYPHIFACLEGAVAIGEGFMSDSVCEMTTDTHIAMQSCHFSFFAPSGVVADRSASVAICFAATSS